MASIGVRGTVNSEAVLKIFIVKAEYNHTEDITNPVVLRKGKLCKRLFFALVEEDEGTRRASRSIDREI
jgi:hypothetical protein